MLTIINFIVKHNSYLSLSILIFEELVEVTGDHAVVKLSYLVGLATVELLKRGVRGDDVDLPGGKGAEVLADLLIKLFNLAGAAKALAVRRVGYDSAAAAGCGDLAAVTLECAHDVGNAGLEGIFLCKLDAFGVNIRCKNLEFRYTGAAFSIFTYALCAQNNVSKIIFR